MIEVPETKEMRKLRWPTTSEQAHYMQMRQRQNRARAKYNPNENWMFEKLKASGHKWTRQAIWGYRLFDFWCHSLGIAVEVDGYEHDPVYDAYRDEYNLRRSAIIVLRVANLNEEDAAKAIAFITASEPWADRRKRFGLTDTSKKNKRHLVTGQKQLF